MREALWSAAIHAALQSASRIAGEAGVPSAAMPEANTAFNGARWRGGYFCLQGASIVAWWAVMFLRPSTMRMFLPGEMATNALTAFLPADVLFAAGSFVTAWLAFRSHPRERLAAWFVAGAACYATLWCVGIWVLTGEALAGVFFMFPCAIASVACALLASRP